MAQAQAAATEAELAAAALAAFAAARTAHLPPRNATGCYELPPRPPLLLEPALQRLLRAAGALRPLPRPPCSRSRSRSRSIYSAGGSRH